ncbi:hypothetical protein [Chondromyces crocatus]|uniref:Uncharacterized protein n=1 Tax=Chondromyces crocatus TaxID=52 RepID=A0A0K1EIF0_CHOCO|nr:hypothetical protein [Chondromyces crocatus]AKT40630.1 uncharacterized protein CMC5_047860 [Chondromyces crocatus]
MTENQTFPSGRSLRHFPHGVGLLACLSLGCVAPIAEIEQDLGVAMETSEDELQGSALELCPIPGTLGEHLSHGNRFDYDPPGITTRRIKGRYEPGDGTVRWRERHAAGSYLKKTVVQGQVSPASPSEATVTYAATTRERDGSERTTDVEEIWQDCALIRWTRDGASAPWLAQEGSWDGLRYAYTQERISRARGYVILLEGVRHPDGTWSEVYEDGSYPQVDETWAMDAGGNLTISWLRNWGDSFTEGAHQRFFDGSQHHRVDYDMEACAPWIEFDVDHAGHGTGEATLCKSREILTPEGEESEEVYYVPCTVTVTAGVCTQSCDDGSTSSCSALLLD